MKRLFRFNSINDANEGRLDVQRMKNSSTTSNLSSRGRSNSKVSATLKSSNVNPNSNNDPTQLKCLFNIHIFALEDFDLMTLASSLGQDSNNSNNLGRSSSFGSNSGEVSIHALGHKMFHNYKDTGHTENVGGNETSRSTNSGISNNSQRSEDLESIAVSNALMKLLQSRYSIHWKVLQNGEEESSSISSLFNRSGSNSVVVGGATEPANVISKTCSNDAIFEDYDYINTCWSRSMSPSTNANNSSSPTVNGGGNKKNSIIYLADFKDYEYDFVCDFKPKKEKSLNEIVSLLNSNNNTGSGSGSQEDPFLQFYVKNMQSLLEEKPLVLEIRELKSSGSGRITSDKRSGFVKLNLTDFVTPPHMIYCGVGSMSKTIMVPVKLSIEAPSNSPLVLTAKLRMQISSMWLTDSLTTRDRQNSKATPIPKYDTFFLVDENESYLVPDSLVNGQTTTRSNDSVSSAPISIKTGKSFNGTPRADSDNTPPQIIFPQLPPDSPPRKNSNNTITISPLMVKKFSSNNNLAVMNSNQFAYSPTRPFSENGFATSIQQEKLDMKIKEFEDSLKRQQSTLRDEVEHIKKDMEDLYSILEIIEAEKEGYCKMSIPEVSLNGTHEAKFFDIEERLKYFVYCDLQGCNQLWSIPHDDITKSMSIYFDVLRRCLKENMGIDTTPAVKHDEFHNIVSDSVVCGFETARQALKFSLLVQTKMMDADWPDSLLSLEGICTYQKNNIKLLFRGLRCRMGISARSKKFVDTTLQAIRRASMIAQFAQGGQTLSEAQVMENLAAEKQNNTLPPDVNTIESLVQRLDNCIPSKSGLKNTTLFLVIPNALKERRFKDLKRQNSFSSNPISAATPTTTLTTIEEVSSPPTTLDASEFPTNESSLVNVLYTRLNSLKEKFRNDIQQKTKDIDMTAFKLQALLETFKSLLADKGDKDAFQIVENQFINQFKELSEELSELKDIQTTNLRTKMKSYETELLRMSMQLLDIRVASPLLTFRTNVVAEPEISPPTIEAIESTLSELHDTPEESITTTSPITPRSADFKTPGEKLNRHLMDLMEHNNLMKRKIQMLNGNDKDSCPSPTAENISI